MLASQLGHYRIVAKLGAGGMAEVFRAHDDRLDRDIALKLLPESTFEDAVARARLLREARAAAALNHPCICTIHEVGETDGQAYIAMELVEGRPLSEIAARHALPAGDVVSYGCQIADALAHAHARGIVHRDLKSANVVVTAEKRVKVLDFGLAKRLSGTGLTHATTEEFGSASLTEHGSVVGTIAYMAPEQLRGEPADGRSDLWALGVMLFEISTGARPFTGKSTFELSANILSRAPSAYPSAVPSPLRVIIDKCLEKDPAHRYQSASDLREALEAMPRSRTSAWPSLRHIETRRPWALPGIAAAALAGVLALLYVPQLRERWLAPASRVESLAVLPMLNLSGDPEQDYFADGITEVLSTDLARLSGLKRVTARSSVIQYKGTTKPLAEIARELNVEGIVTGSVQRSGDRMSITAQLLDPATGDQLWSNRYERNLQDVLALRNEIVTAIVREIRAKLSPVEAARLSSASAVNPDAFEAALKGRFYWLKQTREDFDLAEQYFQQALEKDSNYALAYAGLANVWMMRGDAGFQPPSETFPKARTFMNRALELDDGLADLRVSYAFQLIATEWDWVGAEREFRRAIEINPNLADAHFFYADFLIAQKRPDEWSGEIQRALELDPLNDFDKTYYGWHLNYLGRYDDAIPLFLKLLATGPNKAANYLGLWGAYSRKGMFDQALAAAKEYFTAAGDGEFVEALGAGGSAEAYRAGMKRAGEAMMARSAQRHVPALRIARMFAHAGDADSAMRWLEQAYANHESPLSRLGVVWDWVDLHGDPRFQDLMRRLNLPR